MTSPDIDPSLDRPSAGRVCAKGVNGSQPADSLADSPLGIGFVKMHNKLLEALTAAPFSGVQRRIFDCLYRLTVGWHREVVCISQSELAKCIGLPLSGSFRRALSSLIAAGVVRRLETGSGRRVSSFSLELDFRKWGPFSIRLTDLALRFARRPNHNDSAGRRTRTRPRGADEGYRDLDFYCAGRECEELQQTSDLVNSGSRHAPVRPTTTIEQKNSTRSRDALVHEERARRLLQHIPDEFHADLARLEASAPDVHALYADLDGIVRENTTVFTGSRIGQGIRDFLANGKAKKFSLRTLRRYVDAMAYEPDTYEATRPGRDSGVKRSRYSPDEYRHERERQESMQNRRKLIAGNMSVRLQKPGGEDWLSQMKQEARAANMNLYDYIDQWQKRALVPPSAH